MLINLWVDDLRDPASFKPGENWHWAKTITEAIRILADTNFSVEKVSLDHDVSHLREHRIPGGEYEADTVFMVPVACPENFTAVAHYIAAMPYSRRPQLVYIHTANPIGAKNIEDILRDKVDTVIVKMAHGSNEPDA